MQRLKRLADRKRQIKEYLLFNKDVFFIAPDTDSDFVGTYIYSTEIRTGVE